MKTSLSLSRPDDFHVHLREGFLLRLTVEHASSIFGRVLAMPNLKQPLVTVAQALQYKKAILKTLHEKIKARKNPSFEPLIPLYLSESMPSSEIRAAKEAGLIGIKYYPRGSTTGSSFGIESPEKVFHGLQVMEQEGMVLMIHAEVSDENVDVFDLEKVFLEKVLTPLLRRFEGLRVRVEHLSTKEGVDFVRAHAPRVAGTITAHHLLLNRNDLLFHGLHAHHYCLPIVKDEFHRCALVEAATSGEACFFLGTDSAPHSIREKQAFIGKAGIYTAPIAMGLYAEVFEQAGRLDRLEAFASLNGAAFHGLQPNDSKIILVKEAMKVPMEYTYGKTPEEKVIPFRAGEEVRWRVLE